jgi:hypothetical protein
MRFQKKLCVIAIASLFPVASAFAQTSADTRKEIDALKAQLKVLQEKLEALSVATGDASPLSQQVNRLEQKMDLAENVAEASGFSGMKINGVIEAALSYNDIGRSHEVNATSGYAGTNDYGGFGMVQITKESQDGEGVDWTLRLLPGAASIVHEASLSVPLSKTQRLIAGYMPDFQGYEYSFPHSTPALGNQLITHNALFDLAGATAYTGAGMAYTLAGGSVAFKWMLGNVDGGYDSPDNSFSPAYYDVANAAAVTSVDSALGLYAAESTVKSVALAYRGDWYVNDSTYVGLSGLHGSVNRNFSIIAVDGGYARGDWQINGQVTVGQQARAAANGGDARWTGVSGFVGYKIVPRLQLMARADFIENRTNGGGTYAYNGGSNAIGLGPEGLDSSGAIAYDADTGYATTGANLTRLTLGTNYQINANTQWKTEYRLDQSSGYNFLLDDGTFSKTKNTWGTSLVLSF